MAASALPFAATRSPLSRGPSSFFQIFFSLFLSSFLSFFFFLFPSLLNTNTESHLTTKYSWFCQISLSSWSIEARFNLVCRWERLYVWSEGHSATNLGLSHNCRYVRFFLQNSKSCWWKYLLHSWSQLTSNLSSAQSLLNLKPSKLTQSGQRISC